MSLLRSDYAISSAAILVTATLGLTLLKSSRTKKPPAWIVEHADLGVPRDDKNKIPGTAVVCGGRYAFHNPLTNSELTVVDFDFGSIAGILTARIFADHFEKVVIVDPEFKQTLEGGRKTRVLQYNSFHGMRSP